MLNAEPMLCVHTPAGVHMRGCFGDRDRLFLIVESNDRQDRPKNFFLRDAHRRLHVGEHSRLDEPALAAFGPRRLAAEHALSAFALRDVDVVEDLLVFAAAS